MRTTITAMLRQAHTAAKADQLAEAFWWSGIDKEIKEKTETETFPSCRAAGRNNTTQTPSVEKKKPEILTEPNRTKKFNWILPVQSNQRRAAMYIFY